MIVDSSLSLLRGFVLSHTWCSVGSSNTSHYARTSLWKTFLPVSEMSYNLFTNGVVEDRWNFGHHCLTTLSNGDSSCLWSWTLTIASSKKILHQSLWAPPQIVSNYHCPIPFGAVWGDEVVKWEHSFADASCLMFRSIFISWAYLVTFFYHMAPPHASRGWSAICLQPSISMCADRRSLSSGVHLNLNYN